MNPKISKIDAELERVTAKIAKLQERQRDLEKERMALENTDIIGLVRGRGLTTDQLAALIQGAMPAAPTVPLGRVESIDKEENGYAED